MAPSLPQLGKCPNVGKRHEGGAHGDSRGSATAEDAGERATPWPILALAAIVAAIVLGVWLVNDDDSAGRERSVTVEDIAETTAFDADGFADRLLGRQVTVSGNVSEVIGFNAIRLGGETSAVTASS